MNTQMNTIVRIALLSAGMGIYMLWAFRGIENDLMEAMPALLGFAAGFLLPGAIVAALYLATAGKGTQVHPGILFNCWAATAAITTLGWLVFYSQDPAAAGFFRDNLILGGLLLAGLVALLDFILRRTLDYLMPARR